MPGGDLPPELEIDFMSESLENISKKVLSNDFSSLLASSIPEGPEIPSPVQNNEMPEDAKMEPELGEVPKLNAKKRRTKLQLKTELDRDTCRKWVSSYA